VVGAAFTAVIAAMVKDLITPLIAAIIGQPNFNNLTFTIHKSQFNYGSFLNALISFLIIATVVFFAVVIPLTHVLKRLNLLPDEKAAPPTKTCPECLSDIPVEARRAPSARARSQPGPPSGTASRNSDDRGTLGSSEPR
jgi:large conductance mechanosensitive channel